MFNTQRAYNMIEIIEVLSYLQNNNLKFSLQFMVLLKFVPEILKLFNFYWQKKRFHKIESSKNFFFFDFKIWGSNDLAWR